RKYAMEVLWPRVDGEWREEIDGIVEGVRSRGSAYDRADLVAYNGLLDLDKFEPGEGTGSAGRAKSGACGADGSKGSSGSTGTNDSGGTRRANPVKEPELPKENKRAKTIERNSRCSAFIATGRDTADGNIVVGHETWDSFLSGQRVNVIADIRPTHGHRFIMDTMPGLIHSATDFIINDAGLVITETTISDTEGFDPGGIPEFARIRKASQYAENLDDFYRIMFTGNNGGYANTWLAGDIKTGAIAKLEMGCRNVIFHRSRDGAYYGANYPEDEKL